MPESIPLNIVFEDNDLMVVDKPAGLTVHPAPGHPTGTLANAILAYLGGTPEGSEWWRPGIVHRLDKDTSGLIIVAKNAFAHAKLSEQFKSRSVVKKYLTLVKGEIQPEEGIIEAAIGRDIRNRKRMAVVVNGKGREAKTKYRVLEYINGHSLLEIKPETGRTHQIRVHLAAIGYPVIGDAVYGIQSPNLKRQFLHAALLGFRLPSSGEYVEFRSALPEDLKNELVFIGDGGAK
jgi:23S rRNA pseudouridine1911/1915/1917 synthase